LMNSEKGPLPALNALAEIRKIFMNLMKWLFKVASESKGRFSYVPAEVSFKLLIHFKKYYI